MAFELLWKRQEAKSELPTESAVGILETVYCASLIYLILGQIPGFNQFFYFQYQLFPTLGRNVGYLANAAAIYLLILGAFWLALQLIYDPKHPLLIFLRMLNRRTGIERLDTRRRSTTSAAIAIAKRCWRSRFFGGCGIRSYVSAV